MSVEIGDGTLDEVFEALALSDRSGGCFSPEFVATLDLRKGVD